jgi:hypothetical protein
MESLCAAAGMDPGECVTVPGKHTWLLADPRAFGEVMTNIAGLVPLPPSVEDGGRSAA